MVGVASGALGQTGAASAAAERYPPGRSPRYAAVPVLTPSDRHLVGRFSYGVTPRRTAEVTAAGGAATWFAKQLTTAYDGSADRIADWWPDLHRTPSDLWQRQDDGTRGGWEVMEDYGRRLIMRRMTSPRPVLEIMTDFFENHLHVPAVGDAQFTWRSSYGDVIRAHALGRFSDLLVAAVTHPAMLIFLDAADSTKEHPNENLGRELLELHTVGVGHYTEDDVKSSARILTGYHVDLWDTWAASYQPDDHWTGRVRVADFTDPNTSADGRAMCTRYLTWLAHRPETAVRLAEKLAVRFVRDDPPVSLVRLLAKTYLAHDTAIVPVLRALVASSAFKQSVDMKLKDPTEDVIATHLALGTRVSPPVDDGSAANAAIWQTESIGLSPMTWPRPDGQPADDASWASPARAMASMQTHWDMAGGWWPTEDVTYRTPAQMMPALPVAFRDLVDHLSRTMLGRASTSALLQACCLATELTPSSVVTSASDLLTWRMPRLTVALLDSPTFYRR